MNTSNPINVRRATADDAGTIARFNQAMAVETEDKAIPIETLQAGVLRMVTDEALGFYLVAEHKAEVVGCLGITFEWSDWRNGLFWWIQSVYVAPDARALGVFTAMYEHVANLASQAVGVIGLRLYADADNERAIRTYHRLGMVTTDYKLLEVVF